MDSITLLGLAAGGLTSLSGLPQLLRIIKMRETRDISLEMYIMLNMGVALWLAYGAIKKDTALIFANIVALTFSGLILIYKIRYK